MMVDLAPHSLFSLRFGPDVACDFLERHGLQFLIRGHEVAETGTQVMECGNDKAVVTVFSTANYPNGEGTNMGAVVFLDQEGNATSTEFQYDEPDGSAPQDDPEKALQSCLLQKRSQLVEAFEAIQKQSNGTVTPQQWSSVMNNTMELSQIPWEQLQTTLAPTLDNDANSIDWRYHLDRVAPSLSSTLDEDQANILNSNQEQVQRMFELFDADGSGSN